MKQVKNLQELQKLALQKGASFTLGGQKYNTPGAKEELVPMPNKGEAPAPAPEPTSGPTPPPPAEPQAQQAAPVVNVDMAPIAQAQVQVAQLLAHTLASLPQAATPITKWHFDVARNEAGYIESITATAVEGN